MQCHYVAMTGLGLTMNKSTRLVSNSQRCPTAHFSLKKFNQKAFHRQGCSPTDIVSLLLSLSLNINCVEALPQKEKAWILSL